MEKKKVENREEGVYYSEEFENNCCDKCHDVTFEKTYPAHTAYHACMDLKCKCHSLQKESEWVDELKNLLEKQGVDIMEDGGHQIFDEQVALIKRIVPTTNP